MQCNIVALNCHLKKKKCLLITFFFGTQCLRPQLVQQLHLIVTATQHASLACHYFLFSTPLRLCKSIRVGCWVICFLVPEVRAGSAIWLIESPAQHIVFTCCEKCFLFSFFLSNSMSLYGSILVTYFFSCLRPQLDQRFGSLILLPSMLS